MLQQINFFECMGVLFTVILAILFAFVIWGFFKVRSEMRKPTGDESSSEIQRFLENKLSWDKQNEIEL